MTSVKTVGLLGLSKMGNPMARHLRTGGFMLLVGTGISSKLALGALSAFFPVAINTTASVRQANPVLVRLGRSFRLSRWQMATRI